MRQHEITSTSAGANGHPVAGVRDRLPELAPDALECLVLCLKKQWKCYRRQLRKCQRKFSERSVHDLRVSARRLLSLLDLLAHFLSPVHLEKAQNALKKQLDTFDDLRDTQVQLSTMRKLQERFPAARGFYRFLKKREQRLARATCKKARRLRSKPLGKLIGAAREDVRRWLRTAGTRQAGPSLLSAVNRAFTVTIKLKERIEPDNMHSIHCTRVAFKKLRYVVEALSEHLPWADERLLAGMRAYQTLMGDIQDAEVFLRAFQKFLRKEKGELEQAVRFEHELRRRRQELIGKYLAAADRLLDFWPILGKSAGKAHRAAGNGRHGEKASSRVSPIASSANKNKDL